MEWFRFYSDTLSNPKIRRLSVTARWIWVAVLALANQSPERGALLIEWGLPYTVSDIADAAKVAEADVEEALAVFVAQGMLTRTEDGVYHVTNWDKRQFASDDSAERVRKSRAVRRQPASQAIAKSLDNVADEPDLNSDDTVTRPLQDRYSNGDVTLPDSRVQNTDLTTTTTPRTRANPPEPVDESPTTPASAAPDALLEAAADYVLPLMGRVMLKGTEGVQIQTALAQVDHDLARFKAIVDEVVRRDPTKRIHSFAYFVERFAEEAADRQARAAPRVTRPRARLPDPVAPSPETVAAHLAAGKEWLKSLGYSTSDVGDAPLG